MTEQTTPLATEVGIAAALVDNPDAPVVVAPEPVIEPVVKPAEPVAPVVPDPAAPPAFYTKAWEALEAKGIKIKDEYKQGKFEEGETEHDAFIKTVIENTSFPGEDDPFIQQYLKTPEDQRADMIKNYQSQTDFFSLPPDDGLKKYYSAQKDGDQPLFTEAEINEQLESMSAMQKKTEWAKIKGQVKEAYDAREAELQVANKAKFDQEVIRINDERMALVQAAIKPIDTMTEIGGMPFTDDMKTEVKRNFALLNQVNPVTGQPLIEKFFSQDDNLRDAIMGMTLVRGKSINDFLTSEKENYKEELLDKLELNPKPSSSGGSFTVAQKASDFI